ncbi:MAG TPA: CPXCG motif-containing cysteine-rich protein [Candidatus Dormibacteraeota bacterium]|nr:CPXCG motif-containing cysteine-rich protein [Candidatus Dormibacteraeota bacterium]
MTRRKAMELESLKGRIARIDADSVDRLYGLEPVYEPDMESRASLAPEEFVAVRCPWCGERLETRVDMTADDAAYIEDCEVCCRPIEFSIERGDGGALLSVAVRRLD